MASMSLQAAYDQARQWLESNDLDRAIGLAQHILDHYPDNLEAYRILGEAYLANRQLDRAQESFQRVLRSDPENIPAHVGLGITSERQGQLDRAVAEFEQALEIKPDMAELRSQLLRLYTEGWGSENAQLRLSRAGLARLYAKGHMLPQAIAEFRQVIADQPGRSDAMVALAETLWRDGQEDESMNLCRDILASRPESLKANLLLGYLLMTSGSPEGEGYWRAAERMDPYHGVARALFETLPPGSDEQPTIEEWDEAAWHRRKAAEQQEQIAATRPMEAITPVGTAVGGVVPVSAAPREQPPARPVPAATAFANGGDDFLASLLAIDTPALPPTPPAVDTSDEDLGLNIDMAPFSLDDLNSESRETQPPAPAPAPPTDDAPSMTPFSLSDLGLSDEEIASMDSLGAPAAETPATPQPQADEPTMTPFSLSDLGLSDEEIAGMDSLGAPAAETPATPQPQADEPTMTPFSLSDLGLSDEEIASMDSIGAPAAETPAAPAAEEDDIKISPFSLSDLGLSEEEIAGLESLQIESDSHTSPPAPRASAPDLGDDLPDMSDLPLDLQPFSIDELDLGSADTSTANTGELPSALQPFSLEEPQRPRVSGFISPETTENESAADEEDFTSETRGYSWQQATQKPATSFGKSSRDEPPSSEGSIFSKLKQRHMDTAEQREPEPLPTVSLDADEHLGLFSLDDIPLRDDADTVLPGPPAMPEAPAPTEPEMSAAPPAPEIENLQDALASGQVQPFSLADLGLSDEEIAAMGMGEAPVETRGSEPAQITPAADADDLDSSLRTPTPSDQPAQPSAELSDEGPQLTADLKPFSLSDLGLSDEEINALGLDTPAEAEEAGEMGLGLTEEELEGLDGGDLKWALQPPSPAPTPAEPPPPAPAATSLTPQVTSGDLVVDRLIALGRQQGYIDISDIIAGFEDPEAEAARIEEIGRLLHEAKIEIRDGDEVIDMDADYEEEGEQAVEAAPDDWMAAPEMPVASAPAPGDLGLSPDASDRLGLAEADATAAGAPAQPPGDEPDMTPFSLSELGLSEDEINALGLDESVLGAQASATAEPPAQPSDEPSMTPFSLSELGLSEDEIAALGLGEPAVSSMPAEPDATTSTPDATDAVDLTPAQPEEIPQATEPPPAPVEPPPAAPIVTPVAAAPAQDLPPTPPSAPAPRPARRRGDDETPIFTGNDMLDGYLHQLEAEPRNDILRLSVARIGGQIGMPDLAVQQYKFLIKHNRLLDQVIDELSDLISDSDDAQLLHRLHRVLGDAYSKQGRFREAIEEYSWTLGGPRSAR